MLCRFNEIGLTLVNQFTWTSQTSLAIREETNNNEGLNSTIRVACTHCLLCMHQKTSGNMAHAANLVMSGGAHHLSTELLVGGSKVVLQLLLQVLQNLAVQLLQSGQGGRDPLWPGASAL